MSFSQNSLKVIKDENGVTFYAFNTKDINTIIKSLSDNDINEQIILQLQNQIRLQEKANEILKESNDTLKAQIVSYYAITTNLEDQVKIKQETIDIKDLNILDYRKIESNLYEVIADLKQKLKKKNKTIAKLGGAYIITTVILIILIL
jgi:predicted RNase H-like nuclease (RuvC/YqgF family)